jgi:hypothetical protein
MGPGKWWTLVAGSPAGPDKAASDEEQSPSWRMILNDALTPADVPASAAGWNEISAFALSYYIHTQDGKLRGAYPGEEPSPEADLDQLRGWLLAQQRAIRAGYMGDPDDDPVLLAPLRRVIEAIRQRVGGPR